MVHHQDFCGKRHSKNTQHGTVYLLHEESIKQKLREKYKTKIKAIKMKVNFD